MIKREDTYYCDFCGKSQHEVEKVVAGPDSIGICDECVALAADICGKAAAEVIAQNQEQIDLIRDAERYRALRLAGCRDVDVLWILGTKPCPVPANGDVLDAAADLMIARRRKSNGL